MTAEILLEGDAEYAKANTDRVQEAITRLDEISRYILDRIGFQINIPRTDEAILSSGQMSLETLCTHILNSNEQEWSTKPSFYSGVMLALKERCEAVNKLWSQEE